MALPRHLRAGAARPSWASAVLGLPLLGGCDTIVMKPHGDIAAQQADLIVTATMLMLLIIVPVICLTLLFAWKYRQSNTEAPYTPDWDHSTRLELVIWGAPLLIIIALGAITWISTHKLDPWRALDRIDARRPVPADTRPLVVQVVALDWKWLFVYPELGIATVNELATPVDRPLQFRITSSNVMNAFYVPTLAGMIYAMPGMETRLHAVINRAGEWQGLSANYSGAGFSQMRFRYLGLADADFDRWVERTRAGGGTLDRAAYLRLEQPSAGEPVRHYARVEPELFSLVVNRCVDGSRMCMHQMMAIDAAGGLGRAGIPGTGTRAWGDDPAVSRTVVAAAMCTPANPSGQPAPATGN